MKMSRPQLCLVLVLVIIISSVICLSLDGQSAPLNNIKSLDNYASSKQNFDTFSSGDSEPVQRDQSEDDQFPPVDYIQPIDQSGTLDEDFEDFIDLLPVNSIKNISVNYYKKDPQIRSIVKFIKSDEFIRIRNNIFGIIELQDIFNYLKDIGVNFKDTTKYLKKRFEFNEHIQDYELSNDGVGGVDAYLEEIFSIFPQTEIVMLFLEKVDASQKFASFAQDVQKLVFYIDRLKVRNFFLYILLSEYDNYNLNNQ